LLLRGARQGCVVVPAAGVELESAESVTVTAVRRTAGRVAGLALWETAAVCVTTLMLRTAGGEFCGR